LRAPKHKKKKKKNQTPEKGERERTGNNKLMQHQQYKTAKIGGGVLKSPVVSSDTAARTAV